jgi:hypothetical protein
MSRRARQAATLPHFGYATLLAMTRMSSAQRRYLVLEQGLGSIFVNLSLNAAIAWALFRGVSSVPLWGSHSIVGDTVATCLLLPLLTAIIVSALTHRAVRMGRLEPLPSAGIPFAGRPVARGAVLGALCVAIVAPLAIGGFVAARTAELSFGSFVAFKACFAALLGLPVTPLIAWAALTDASHNRRLKG